MKRITKGIFAIAFALVSIAQAQADSPAIDVNERTEYYDVRGPTTQELVAEIRTLGPVSSKGRRSWALTDWEARANYDLTPGSEGCKVIEPRAQIEIVTTLPRWPGLASAPWWLRARWDNMLTSLMLHERAHRAHAELAARTAVENLRELPPQATCAAADRAAQQAFRTAVAASRRLSVEYDQATNFGESDGMSLLLHGKPAK